MKLLQYLKLSKIDDETFAGAIGVTVSGLRKWKYGERVPRPKMIERIVQETQGAVTANDFYEAPRPSYQPDTRVAG